MQAPTIAFLGPEGTFAHLAAQRRFGSGGELVPFRSIKDVFSYVGEDPNHIGIVPIENSSGGTIRETVEQLTSGFRPLFIQESLSVNVRLALLGRKRESIKIIYSHFAPLHHCEKWLASNFPDVELRAEPSTAIAIQKAAANKEAAAIGNRNAGRGYNLKVLEFPIEKDSKNVTQFFLLGHARSSQRNNSRTTIIAALPNKPGSLVNFLEPFANSGVNLSRLISQPVIGQPATYIFLVDIDGTEKQASVRKALKKAEAVSNYLRNIGSYPVRPAYNS